ncbi:MAG: winged helix-turn-helix domain-containing protein, partial [Akkermansia sp.]
SQDGCFAGDALAKDVWENSTEIQQKRFNDLKDDKRRLFDVLKEELSDESFEILSFCSFKPYSKADIFEHIGLTNQSKNSKKYLKSLIDKDLISPTIKDRPQSRHQKYVVTNMGKLFVDYIAYLESIKAGGDNI